MINLFKHISLRTQVFLSMILLVLMACLLILFATYYQYQNESIDYNIFRLNRKEDFYSILKNGQDQGLVRKSLNIELISIMYTNIINSTFQPEFFIENSLMPKDVLPALVEMVSGGLLSEDGRKYYGQIKGNIR